MRGKLVGAVCTTCTVETMYQLAKSFVFSDLFCGAIHGNLYRLFLFSGLNVQVEDLGVIVFAGLRRLRDIFSLTTFRHLED